jgi:hypothetical protein
MGKVSRRATAERTLSTRTVWNVLDLSGCQIAVILWERSASRRRMVSTVKGSWAVRESDRSEVEEGTGSGDGGTSRPATNITGASCTTSSGGYEFMLRSALSEARNGEVSGALRTSRPQAQTRTLSSNLNFLLHLKLCTTSTLRLHIFHILFGGNPAVSLRH